MDATLRPLGADDLDVAVDILARALPWDDREWTPELLAGQRRRLEHSLASDREGCWAAERDGRVRGVVVALLSEGIWVLSLLIVDPDDHGGGLGRALIERGLAYGGGGSGGLIAASTDQRALRLYGGAGFSLLPTFTARGEVARAAIPGGLDVRAGDEDDLDIADAVDRVIRGGARREHLRGAIASGARLYVTERDGRGYLLARGDMLIALGATTPQAAQRLLWQGLAEAAPGTATVRWITGGQDWALEVARAARLSLRPDGPICTRGRLGPLWPFLPSGAYL